MSEEKKSLFENLSAKQTFVGGIVVGFLVICAVGFFVMLTVYFKGSAQISPGGDSSDNNTNTNTNTDTTSVTGPEQFSKCLDSDKYYAAINADQQLGTTLGVNGTPATFVNGYLISGAYPYEAVKDVIDDTLAGRKVFLDNYKTYGLESGDLPKVEMPNLPDVVWKGDVNAKVAAVEFADFECPYCVRFYATMEQVLTNYGNQIKYTYRHFPLTQIHKNAQKMAEAYECAKEQGKWFEMYQKLFTLSDQQKFGVDNYKAAANELGLK